MHNHNEHDLDKLFFLKANNFFLKHCEVGLTFDDVSLATLYSEILPKQTSLQTRLSNNVVLNVPIISSDMDTVTEELMATHMALNGGMGVIHYNMSADMQVEKVAKVKSFSLGENTSEDCKPAVDSKGKLLCAVAISAPRSSVGALDNKKLLEHVENLVNAGVDAIAVSSAHGFSNGIGEVVKAIRQRFEDLTIIAGNVTSGAGVEYLSQMGANVIKIGQGPGSICTTRVVAGVGIPQLTALYAASESAKVNKVKIIADGGISKSGDMVKALTLSDAVMCGSLLAGCKEAPGETFEINNKLYKSYRGMGSLVAMKSGSAARYGHTESDTHKKVTAEGIEGMKEVVGNVKDILKTLAGGIQSGLGYLGAKDLEELKERARFIRITPSAQAESATHNVITLNK